MLKAADGKHTTKQAAALAELEATDLFTATAWRIKEKLRWIRNAETVQAARWRITSFIRQARECIAGQAIIEPVRKALETFENHRKTEKSGHRLAAEKSLFPRRWYGGMISANLEVIWEMSANSMVARRRILARLATILLGIAVLAASPFGYGRSGFEGYLGNVG